MKAGSSCHNGMGKVQGRQMRFKGLGIAIVLLLALWVGTSAQQAPAEQFRYRFEPNNQSRYHVSAQMSGTLPLFGGLPVQKVLVEMTMVLKVRQVRPDGNAELGMDIEAFKAEMDGQALPLPLERLRASVRDLLYVVNPQGEVVERKGAGVLPFNLPVPGVEVSQLPLLVLQLVFPKEPISSDREWVYSRVMTSVPNDTPAQFTARWLKDEPLNGLSASLFSQKMRWSRSFKADIFDQPTADESLMVKQIEQSVTGEAQIWFNRQEGKLLKATLNAQYVQQTRQLNPSESSAEPTSVQLTAKVQITREDLGPRETETKQTGT